MLVLSNVFETSLICHKVADNIPHRTCSRLAN